MFVAFVGVQRCPGAENLRIEVASKTYTRLLYLAEAEAATRTLRFVNSISKDMSERWRAVIGAFPGIAEEYKGGFGRTFPRFVRDPGVVISPQVGIAGTEFISTKGRKTMRIVKRLALPVFALMGLMVWACAPAKAQGAPQYIKALGELRTARDYLHYNTGQYANERKAAVDEINAALDEIKHAAWDDGEQTKYSSPGQGASGTWAPEHYAYSWLRDAIHDVSEGSDNPQNIGVRDRALAHMQAARRMISDMIGHGAQ